MTPTNVLIYSSVAQAHPPSKGQSVTENPWMLATGGLLVLLVGLGVVSHLKTKQLIQRLDLANHKNQELQRKMKLAVQTITKMERNPDLIHSRECNLDYLRMRMEEDAFHSAIVNQLKAKVKQKISVALRPQPVDIGVVSTGSKLRLVDEIFDVEYNLSDNPGAKKRVLFRIQIKLAKLPTQTTSATINQLVDCIEKYMSPQAEDRYWQPTIQGRIANMRWDQKAKPTPLLVIEQSNDGVNVTLRSKNPFLEAKAQGKTA